MVETSRYQPTDGGIIIPEPQGKTLLAASLPRRLNEYPRYIQRFTKALDTQEDLPLAAKLALLTCRIRYGKGGNISWITNEEIGKQLGITVDEVKANMTAVLTDEALIDKWEQVGSFDTQRRRKGGKTGPSSIRRDGSLLRTIIRAKEDDHQAIMALTNLVSDVIDNKVLHVKKTPVHQSQSYADQMVDRALNKLPLFDPFRKPDSILKNFRGWVFTIGRGVLLSNLRHQEAVARGLPRMSRT